MSRVFAVLLVFALTVPAAQAQKPNIREGFWISFGFGAGAAKLNGDLGFLERENGLSGYARLGGTVSPNLLLGAESNGWVSAAEYSDDSFGFLGPIAMYYPSRTGSFYLKGGLGVVTVGEIYSGPEGAGFGFSLGAGNEFRLGKNFSLNLFANVIQGVGVDVNGYKTNPNWVQIGLGVVWH
jgi:hypothetical protein